jgi:type I restriction enzyme S subunit
MSDIAGVADAPTSQETSAYPPSIQPGIPKLGPTPKGWTRYTLGDLLRPVERPADLIDVETYQLVTAKRSRGGIVAREILRGDQIRTKTQFYVEAGDFLISNRQISHGACGLVPKSLHQAIVSNEYTVFRTSDDIDHNFLNILSNSTYFQQTCFHSSIGVHVEKLVFRLNDWLSWEFDIPPLAYQRRIIVIVDAWDRAIGQVRQLLAAVCRQRNALCRTFFSDSGTPRSWSKQRLADAVGGGSRVIGGPFGSDLTSSDYVTAGVPVIRGTNMEHSGRWVGGDYVYVTQEKAKSLRRNLARRGDIIVTQRGTMGQVSIIPETAHFEEFVVSQSQMAISCTNYEISTDYLYYFLTSARFQNTIRVETIQTGLPHINLSILRNAEIFIPPLAEQNSIVKALNIWEGSIERHTALLGKLTLQKNELVRTLLAGEWQPDAHLQEVLPAPALAAI